MGACVNSGEQRKSVLYENRQHRDSISNWDGQYRLARKTFVPGMSNPLEQPILRNTVQSQKHNDIMEIRKLPVHSPPLKHRNTVTLSSGNLLKPQMILKSRKQIELREKYRDINLTFIQKNETLIESIVCRGNGITPLILRTITLLANEPSLKSNHLPRYDYNEIRNFLKVSEWEPESAAKLIYSDIEWRNKTFPFKTIELSNIIKSRKVVMQGTDKVLSPCIYVQPNFISTKNSIVSMKEYFKYFVYVLEDIVTELERRELASRRVTMIIDFQEKEFRIDLLEVLQEVFMEHYPGRLNKIFILNISLTTIDSTVQQKFQQQFYKDNIILLADRYPEHLLKHFYAQELRQEYGGTMIGHYDPEHITDYRSISEYLIHEFKNYEFKVQQE